MRKVAKYLIAFCLISISTATSAQEVQLTTDAEYAGALLATGKPVSFYKSGRVSAGTLKKDFRSGPYVFQANSVIAFYEDGSVSSGVLAQPATDGRYSFVAGKITFHPNGTVSFAKTPAGLTDENLVVPVAANVGFDADGRISAFGTDVPQNVTVLNRSVATGNGISFSYDKVGKRYFLLKGVVGDPQLIARVVTKFNPVGLPEAVLPIVAPYATGFSLFVPDATQAGGGRVHERWVLPNSFNLNGKNFGNGPTLLVRDMQLVGVQLAQAIVIDGIQYKAADVINLNIRGQIVTNN